MSPIEGTISSSINILAVNTMQELPLITIITLSIFGLGGAVALSIVPWACIGTGLYNQNKRYQSGPEDE